MAALPLPLAAGFPHHVFDSVIATKERLAQFPNVQNARMAAFLEDSEHVVEPERNAKVFAPGAPRRVMSHAGMVGISYPGVHYHEAARFWSCEAFNVNPLPCYGCMERVR